MDFRVGQEVELINNDGSTFMFNGVPLGAKGVVTAGPTDNYRDGRLAIKVEGKGILTGWLYADRFRPVCRQLEFAFMHGGSDRGIK